jgi:ribosomal protein L15E
LVFIRVRKPCVFERRRRLGWKVRFGMKNCCSSVEKIRVGPIEEYS